MYRPVRNLFVMAVIVVLTVVTGCTTQQDPPSVRRSRTIAAENIELKKKIQQLEKQIEDLKAQHEKESAKLTDELQECTEERDAWKARAQKNIRNQVKGVLDSVVDDNSRLRQENEGLKNQIEKLKSVVPDQ